MELFIKLWLLWGLLDFIILHFFTVGGRIGMEDIKLVLAAQGWNLISVGGVVVIFVWSIILGPISTYRSWKMRRLWRRALEMENNK